VTPARPASPRRPRQPRQGPAENGALAASTASEAKIGGSGRCVDAGASSEHHGGPTDAVLDAMSEKELQASVRTGLEQRGWWVYVFPVMLMTRPGWPDIAALHPDKPGWLLLWECKSQKGRVRPEQRALIEALQSAPGIDARIVRPSDWQKLKEWV
jgi:hypothetical protein